MADRRWADHPLVQLTRCRYLEFIREPEALFWTFIFPVLMTAGLGLAFRDRPAEQVHVAVVTGAGSDLLAARLEADGRLLVETADDTAAARLLRTGQVAVAVVPVGPDSVVFRYDRNRDESQIARLLTDQVLQQGAGRADVMAVSDELVHERGSRYIDFLVPGLLGMNLMGTGVWATGFAIVDQRRRKLLKRLVATPMSRAHYLASFMLSRLGLLVMEVGVILGFGVWVFGVPVRGSVLLVLGLALLTAMMFAALGLLLAARPRTIEGASGLMNLALVPMWVLSGVFFSASNFPDAVQPLIQALPLTAAVDAVRATMLEGASFMAVGHEVLIMLGWLAGCFFLALRVFRWE